MVGKWKNRVGIILHLVPISNAFVSPLVTKPMSVTLNVMNVDMEQDTDDSLAYPGLQENKDFDVRHAFDSPSLTETIITRLNEVTGSGHMKQEDNLPVISPGLRENDVFKCDSSVEFWKEYASSDAEQRVQNLKSNIMREIGSSRLARAYFSSHLFRTGYFTISAALGTIGSDFYSESDHGSNTAASKKLKGKSFIKPSEEGMVQKIVGSGVAGNLLQEAFQTYNQDFKFLKSGLMKYPWDAIIREEKIQFDHRQMNPFFALSETASLIRESIEVFSRRNKQSSGGVYIDPQDKHGIYPDYYLNDFHYQTDGWLSSASAKQYEMSTETLFLGRQDAMQRQTLIPLLKRETKPETMLEVACGTGRLGTFTRDNFPSAQMTYVDLSPYYLEKAKDNDKYWMSYRGEDAMKESTGRKRMPSPAKFVQANAEFLPFNDNSFDAVTCVYLFHELPKEARERAAKEMVRVVKSGGMVVLTDSLQKGDRPGPFEDKMENFSYLNEPYYRNYIETYLPDIFEGCDMSEKYVVSSTKSISFIKR